MLPIAVLGVIGLALLGYEAVEALRGVVLGTTGTVLLYVGLALTLLAAGLVVLDLTTVPEPAGTETQTPPTAELVEDPAG
jgi:uncharacterized membrane protein